MVFSGCAQNNVWPDQKKVLCTRQDSILLINVQRKVGIIIYLKQVTCINLPSSKTFWKLPLISLAFPHQLLSLKNTASLQAKLYNKLDIHKTSLNFTKINHIVSLSFSWKIQNKPIAPPSFPQKCYKESWIYLNN